MRTRRIVLANNARLLREMLKRALDKADDLQVVRELAGLSNLDGVIEQAHPDWLIISPDQAPAAVGALVAEHPDLRVITVSSDGSRIRIWREGAGEEKLDGLSLGELLSILRDEKDVLRNECCHP